MKDNKYSSTKPFRATPHTDRGWTLIGRSWTKPDGLRSL